MENILSTLSENISLIVGIAILIAAILGALSLRNSSKASASTTPQKKALDKKDYFNEFVRTVAVDGIILSLTAWAVQKFLWWFTIQSFSDAAVLDLKIRTGDVWFGHHMEYPDMVFIAWFAFALFRAINYRDILPGGEGLRHLGFAITVVYTLYQWWLWASAWTNLW